jgi:hypothetical protein
MTVERGVGRSWEATGVSTILRPATSAIRSGRGTSRGAAGGGAGDGGGRIVEVRDARSVEGGFGSLTILLTPPTHICATRALLATSSRRKH